MQRLPLCVDLRGRGVLVVGGGAVAQRKIELLLRAGPRLRVVAPVLSPPLQRRRGDFAWCQRGFEPADLDDTALVVAATDDEALNARIAGLAAGRGVLVNVVDRPALCSVTFPAIVNRDPLLVAIASGGQAPVLVRQLRARIEALLPPRLGPLVDAAGRVRERLAAREPSLDQRRRLWEGFWPQVFDGTLERLLEPAAGLDLDPLLDDLLRAAGTARGSVALVGAGPGDPELLTLRAARLLDGAEVIVHDRLVAPEILERARRDAERIDLGARPLAPADIAALLVELARAGRRVVRLKGGDPGVFGRLGEELATLRSAGIPASVVPGITAASACAAALHLPLTASGRAGHCTLVTARDGAAGPDWPALAALGGTLAIYMGGATLPAVVDGLRAGGLADTTPAAWVAEATRPAQTGWQGTLGTLAEATTGRPEGPMLVLVGPALAD